MNNNNSNGSYGSNGSTGTPEHGILVTLPSHLMDILPNEYNLFYYKVDNQYLIYISNNVLELQEIKKSIGYISFVIDYEESELSVLFLLSNLPKRGIGHYLMIIAGYIASNQGIKKVLLEDDSDMAHKGSVYEKLGCEYMNPRPEPEMECKPRVILGKYEQFYDKYVNKYGGFFVKL